MGIAYSTVGDHEGTKTKIQNAYKVKEHFEVRFIQQQIILKVFIILL